MATNKIPITRKIKRVMGEQSKEIYSQRKGIREERNKIQDEEKKSRQSFWGSMYTTVTGLGGYVQWSAIGKNRWCKSIKEGPKRRVRI
jgi:hypothetical protein